MKVWLHKEKGDFCFATPWWEIPEANEVVALKADEAVTAGLGENRIKFGVLVQVGWLIQNQNDMWLGVGMKAQEAFEDLGDL